MKGTLINNSTNIVATLGLLSSGDGYDRVLEEVSMEEDRCRRYGSGVQTIYKRS